MVDHQGASAAETADHYLSSWGGLADGLPRLAADPTLGEVDGGAGLRNLVPDLLAAGRDEDVHRLLACERPAASGRPGVVNLWFDARHRAGDVDGYLQDLDAAHRRARKATDAALTAGRQPGSLGLEMRYALMRLCAKSTGERVDDDVAVLLVETGLWDISRALANARRHDMSESRCRALLALLPYVPEARKRDVVRAALVGAVRNCWNHIRGGANDPLVDELAPMLPSEDWPGILSLVEKDMDEHLGGEVLTPLVPHLPVELMSRALAIAATLPPNIHRTIALEKLAPHLPEVTAVDALPAAREITDPKYRADVLTALLPRLPEDIAALVRAEACAAAGKIDPPVEHDDPVRRWRWTRLIPLLPAEERAAAVAEAAREEDAEGHADLLADVATELPAAERGPFLAEALRLADDITDPFDRAQTLLVITDLLPLRTQAATLADALVAARAIAEPFDRVRTLLSVVERLSATDRDAVLDEALTDARWIIDDDDRAVLLTEIAALLPLERQGPPLAEAVRSARAVEDDDRRFELLLETAELLTDQDRRTVLADALEIGLNRVHQEIYFNGWVLDKLAPVLTEDLMIEMLEAVRGTGRRGYLARVLHRRAKHLTGTALEAGLALARTVTGRGRARQRAAVLTALSDQLPSERRADVLEEALTAAREAGSDLTAIARRLPEDRRVALMTEQLTLRRYRFSDTPTALAPPTVGFEAVRVPEKWGGSNAARAYLVRAQRAHRRGATPATVIGLIREALCHRYNPAEPPGSPALAAAARDLGGPAAVDDYLRAVQDIHRWWP